MDLILPFKKGDFAETKSFIDGYKGAWFLCKIIDMHVTEKGELEYLLEFVEYPDEEKTWTLVFEKNPAYGKRNSNVGRECMIRPSYPELYRGGQIPEQLPKSNVIVSVCDTPKVGDRIEWLSEGCYWTAEIIKLLSEDMVKVELLKPPIGEGRSYDAHCKDIRPALDWSLEKGWTVPRSQANGQSWYAARLHKSDTQESSSDEEGASDDDEEQAWESSKRTSNTSQEAPGSSNQEITSESTAISRLNSQTATVATTVGTPRPSSVSKSLGHSHAAQAAVNRRSHCGTRSSSRQQRVVDTSVPPHKTTYKPQMLDSPCFRAGQNLKQC